MDKRSFGDRPNIFNPVPPGPDDLEVEPIRDHEYWETYNTNVGRIGLLIIIGVFGLGVGYMVFSRSPRIRNVILLLTPVTLIAIVFMARYIVYSYNRDKQKLESQQNSYHGDHRIR